MTTDTREGRYRVVVELDGETILESEGWAQNPTDALYRAINKREEELHGMQMRAAD